MACISPVTEVLPKTVLQRKFTDMKNANESTVEKYVNIQTVLIANLGHKIK